MKTQLLEDIGQNAALSLTPPKTAADSQAGNEVHALAPAGNAAPSKPRSALGVWRQEPAGKLPASTPGHQTPPLELHDVLEEIAALEAQYVPPGRRHEPAIAPVEPLHQPAEPTFAPNPAQSATAPQDPFFDFTAPSPAPQEADPFTHAPTGSTRPRQPYLLWAACLLCGALLILGGRWLYQERKAADEAKEELRRDQAVKQPAIAAKEVTPGPEGEVGATAAVSASRPLPAPPPLVMLEPDPSTAVKPEQPSPSAARRAEVQAPLTPEPVAEQGSDSPLPKPPGRIARKHSEAAAVTATESDERAPVRRYARASAIGNEGPSERDTGMAATLRACREHGYHAAQCIKRACSVTEYGFVCRGR
jgi:hypothetical protein